MWLHRRLRTEPCLRLEVGRGPAGGRQGPAGGRQGPRLEAGRGPGWRQAGARLEAGRGPAGGRQGPGGRWNGSHVWHLSRPSDALGAYWQQECLCGRGFVWKGGIGGVESRR
eukprot:157300-Chlamydomonas_euryale.AAC.1